MNGTACFDWTRRGRGPEHVCLSIWYFFPPVGKVANLDQIGGRILSAVFEASTRCRFDVYAGWHQHSRKCCEQIFDVQDSLFSCIFPPFRLHWNGSSAVHCYWVGANAPFFPSKYCFSLTFPPAEPKWNKSEMLSNSFRGQQAAGKTVWGSFLLPFMFVEDLWKPFLNFAERFHTSPHCLQKE